MRSQAGATLVEAAISCLCGALLLGEVASFWGSATRWHGLLTARASLAKEARLARDALVETWADSRGETVLEDGVELRNAMGNITFRSKTDGLWIEAPGSGLPDRRVSVGLESFVRKATGGGNYRAEWTWSRQSERAFLAVEFVPGKK